MMRMIEGLFTTEYAYEQDYWNTNPPIRYPIYKETFLTHRTAYLIKPDVLTEA